jgi:methylmalonyl-CoA mutase
VDPDQGKSEEIGNGGVSIFSEADISTLLEVIDLEKTPLFIQTGAIGLPIFSMLMAYLQKQGKESQDLRGCIGMDLLRMLVK